MSRRTLTLVILLLTSVAPCHATTLDALLFPLTGEVRLRNSSASAVPFVYYSITSPSAALDSSPGVWLSISDNYDASGNGFMDPDFDWTKISATSTELTEGAFSGPGGNLLAFRSVSFGEIWNPALYPSNDLLFTVLQADITPIAVAKQFAIDGDYNSDGTVDDQDYVVWRQSLGSMTTLNADGNLNGVIDIGDYNIWRSNFGQTLPGMSSLFADGASLSPAGIAVPEPTTAILVLLSALAALIPRAAARRAGRGE